GAGGVGAVAAAGAGADCAGARPAGHAARACSCLRLPFAFFSQARLQFGSNSSAKMLSALQHFVSASLFAPSAALPAVIPPCVPHSPLDSEMKLNFVVPGMRTNSANVHVI